MTTSRAEQAKQKLLDDEKLFLEKLEQIKNEPGWKPLWIGEIDNHVIYTNKHPEQFANPLTRVKHLLDSTVSYGIGMNPQIGDLYLQLSSSYEVYNKVAKDEVIVQNTAPQNNVQSVKVNPEQPSHANPKENKKPLTGNELLLQQKIFLARMIGEQDQKLKEHKNTQMESLFSDVNPNLLNDFAKRLEMDYKTYQLKKTSPEFDRLKKQVSAIANAESDKQSNKYIIAHAQYLIGKYDYLRGEKDTLMQKNAVKNKDPQAMLEEALAKAKSKNASQQNDAAYLFSQILNAKSDGNETYNEQLESAKKSSITWLAQHRQFVMSHYSHEETHREYDNKPFYLGKSIETYLSNNRELKVGSTVNDLFNSSLSKKRSRGLFDNFENKLSKINPFFKNNDGNKFKP